MTTRKCNQTKCGFFIMGQGCRRCKECKAEPFIVDDNCDKCWNCENDAGLLRWDDEQDNLEEEAVKEKEKPMLIPMKMGGN